MYVVEFRLGVGEGENWEEGGAEFLDFSGSLSSVLVSSLRSSFSDSDRLSSPEMLKTFEQISLVVSELSFWLDSSSEAGSFSASSGDLKIGLGSPESETLFL